MKKEATAPFDYELAKQKLKEQFRTGQPLFGKGGAFAPLPYPTDQVHLVNSSVIA